MSKDSGEHEAPTRRDYMKYGGAVVGGGLLAGCAGQSDSESTPSETGAEDDLTATQTPEDESYSVTMPPMGEVEFESVPETYIDYDMAYGDMAIALGQADGHRATHLPEQIQVWMFDDVGVSIDPNEIAKMQFNEGGGIDKEWFYEMDCDVHFMDPEYWGDDSAAIEEISQNVGPFFGNFARRTRGISRDYPFLSLYEIFEKVAEVFQQEERYQAFATLHDEFLSGIQEQLPPKSERPSIALIWLDPSSVADEKFWAYHLDEGWEKKQYTDLGLTSSIEGKVPDDQTYIQIDYEFLLEADPDLIMGFETLSYLKERDEFESGILQPMRDHPIGSQLTAVQNDRVYIGGIGAGQGPISNLFQTEAAAKQIFPETFGEFPGWGNVSGDEHLFDRQRVADIINGDI